jgi:hypothetical protein
VVTKDLVLAAHARPSYGQASPTKLASDPNLRQINPAVVTGFITIGSEEPWPGLSKAKSGTKGSAHSPLPGFVSLNRGYEQRKGSGMP